VIAHGRGSGGRGRVGGGDRGGGGLWTWLVCLLDDAVLSLVFFDGWDASDAAGVFRFRLAGDSSSGADSSLPGALSVYDGGILSVQCVLVI